MSLTEQTWCKRELFSAQRYWICIMEVFQQNKSSLKGQVLLKHVLINFRLQKSLKITIQILKLQIELSRQHVKCMKKLVVITNKKKEKKDEG
jgi:hypothetical protein